MTLKSDKKSQEKVIFCFKTDKNLMNFDLSPWNTQNFCFDWFLLCKTCNVWPKKVKRSYLSWHWRVMQNLKSNWFVVSKLTRIIWQSLTQALKSLNNFHFNWLILSKLYIKLENYGEVIFRDIEKWCKTWRGIDMSFQNWLGVFDKFWPRALERLKNLHFNWLSLTKVDIAWAKNVRRSYVW